LIIPVVFRSHFEKSETFDVVALLRQIEMNLRLELKVASDSELLAYFTT
jgi:hypothetical protein